MYMFMVHMKNCIFCPKSIFCSEKIAYIQKDENKIIIIHVSFLNIDSYDCCAIKNICPNNNNCISGKCNITIIFDDLNNLKLIPNGYANLYVLNGKNYVS